MNTTSRHMMAAGAFALLVGSVSAWSARAEDGGPGSAARHVSAQSEDAIKARELLTDAAATAERLAREDSLAWVRENVGRVKGIFIVPEHIKGAFMIGGSGGSGVVSVRNADGGWSSPAFYSMGSLSFGLQAGGQVSEIVLLAMTDRGLNAFKSPSFKLGGDVSVAAGPVGVGAKAQTTDVLAFSRTKGLYGGISLEGAVIDPREDLNRALYGRAVTPEAILFGTATLTGADAADFKAALARLGERGGDVSAR